MILKAIPEPETSTPAPTQKRTSRMALFWSWVCIRSISGAPKALRVVENEIRMFDDRPTTDAEAAELWLDTIGG